jgi:hypothetical protein
MFSPRINENVRALDPGLDHRFGHDGMGDRPQSHRGAENARKTGFSPLSTANIQRVAIFFACLSSKEGKSILLKANDRLTFDD